MTRRPTMAHLPERPSRLREIAPRILVAAIAIAWCAVPEPELRLAGWL